MIPTVLLTLGRLPTALYLARGFHDLGWRVVVAEPFAWHLCRPSRCVARSHKVIAPTVDSARYVEEIRAIAARENAALILPVSEETMHLAAPRDRPWTGSRLYAPDRETVLALHSKRRFNAMARELGLPVPETFGLEESGARGQGGRRPGGG